MKTNDTESSNGALTGRIPELDGLRGAAILLVVVMHYFYFYPTAHHHPLETVPAVGEDSIGVDGLDFAG